MPLSCSVKPVAEEPVTERLKKRSKKREQKGVDKGDHEQKLEAIMPVPKTGTLQSKLRFSVAEGDFNLPAATVGEDNAPRIINRLNRFIGEQIPGFATFAGSGNNEPERVVIVRMLDRSEDNAGLAPATAATVPDVAVVEGAFATGNVPSIDRILLDVDQLVTLGPRRMKRKS